MAKFTKFEDMEVWRQARELSKNIYAITNQEKFNNDFALIRQIRRSSGSVMDNIAEGFGRGGNKEFIRFLMISMGSAFELKSQLYRAIDQKYITDDEFRKLYSLADHICKMINGLSSYLKKSNLKGSKYNQQNIPTKNQKTKNEEQSTKNFNK